MGETVIFAFYLIILTAQIALLVYNILRPRKLFWEILLGAEALSTLSAWLLMRYFDSLPGTGKAPGLTYLGETLFSMGAVIAYSVMLGISLTAGIILFLRKRNQK